MNQWLINILILFITSLCYILFTNHYAYRCLVLFIYNSSIIFVNVRKSCIGNIYCYIITLLLFDETQCG